MEPLQELLIEAISLYHSNQKQTAYHQLTELWSVVRETSNSVLKCVLAHYAASLEDNTESSLKWRRIALENAYEAQANDLKPYGLPDCRNAFMSSLYLNLAENYQKLGDPTACMWNLKKAESTLKSIPENNTRNNIETSILRLRGASTKSR